MVLSTDLPGAQIKIFPSTQPSSEDHSPAWLNDWLMQPIGELAVGAAAQLSGGGAGHAVSVWPTEDSGVGRPEQLFWGRRHIPWRSTAAALQLSRGLLSVLNLRPRWIINKMLIIATGTVRDPPPPCFLSFWPSSAFSSTGSCKWLPRRWEKDACFVSHAGIIWPH